MNGKMCPFFVAVVFGLMSQFTAQAQTCTAVDAITTSTLKLTNGSKACESTADLIFTYTKTNGSRPFSYGKTTAYGTNGGDVSGATRTTTIKLTGLEKGTKYYFKVEGIYADAGGLQYTMIDSFTTNASAGTKPVSINHEPVTLINIGKTAVAIPYGSDNNLKVQLFSMNGSLVFKDDISTENCVASIPLHFNNAGIYLCRVSGATTLQNQVVTILK